ncbi:MAG: DUF2085 domain-containing protein [Clostridiaceae bacterium]|nr:DUF2085 domain-containing protein [Clostridiaceae bacterium]
MAGSLICHQLPERSLESGGMILPVCARDTGIYAGIFTAFIFLLLLRRMKAQRPPGLVGAVIMCVLMLPMMLDGALSYMGLIETNNAARIFTGLLFGLPIPFLLIPAAHFRLDGRNEAPVLKRPAELVPVYCIGILLCVLLLYGLVPYIAAGLIFVTGFLLLISRLAYTVLVRIGIGTGWKLYLMTFVCTASILTVLYFFSSYVLHPLQDMLLRG